MGVKTALPTPIDTPISFLDNMSVDELVNIIKEEEGIISTDDHDADITLSLSDHDHRIRDHHHNSISPPSIVEDTNDGDSYSNHEDSDSDDDDDDNSDDGNNHNNSYDKGPHPPPYYPYPPYHYPMPPPHHAYMPHDPHDPYSNHHLYTGTGGSSNPHVYTDASTMVDPAPDTRRNRGGVTEPFPEKLHRMLDAVEREGLSDVVSFFSHGRAFAIHKPRRFVTEVMHRFFRQTRLTSFQRQLNLYGFRRISTGPDNGGYYHELFLKGRPGLCVNMKRTKVKGTSKLKRDPDTEPNFYAMRPIAAGGPPPSSNSNNGSNNRPPNPPPYYPPYYPPPPPPASYPPYTAAQNGNMPPPPHPGYYPPPPPYGYSPYPWYPHAPPHPPTMKNTRREDVSSPLPPHIQSQNSLDDLEVPESPLAQVTEDDV